VAKKVSFGQLYCNAFRYYHRLGNLIYSHHTAKSRVVKTMNTYCMLSITLAITVGLLYEAEPNQSFTTG
jgi:hypothetical protein